MPPRPKAALDIVHKLTLRPEELGPEDIDAAMEAGLDERAIQEAMYVCFAFNVIDRLADAFDFPIQEPSHQRRTAAFLWRFGYRGGALPP